MDLTFPVPAEFAGAVVLSFLRQLGVSARSRAELKRENGILLNGVPVRVDTVLSAGDAITLRFPPEESDIEPNFTLTAEPLYADRELLVWEKPAGMPTHPSHLHRDDTLANRQAAYLAALGETAVFRPVFRLDKNTSGFCVTARHRIAAHLLMGHVEKRYLALLTARPPAEQGVIRAPIRRAEESVILRTVATDGQDAITHYRVLGEKDGRWLAVIRLETGRTHQIRVHFSSVGASLVGDTLYGCDTALPRHALHCAAVRLTQPLTGEPLSFISPLPADMAALASAVPENLFELI